MRIYFKTEKRKPKKPFECEYCGILVKHSYMKIMEIYKDEGVSHKNRVYKNTKTCLECVEIVKKLNDRFCEENRENIFN